VYAKSLCTEDVIPSCNSKSVLASLVVVGGIVVLRSPQFA
jgi:hypothetical protein